MATAVEASISWNDAKNQKTTTRFCLTAGADAAADQAKFIAVFNAAAALSHATAYGGPFYSPAPVAAGGTAGKFIDVEDKAVFVFQTAGAAIHRYMIPAPVDTVFQADDETIDYSNAAVAAFAAAVVANVCSKDASPITVSVGGYRTRVKLQRRFNVFTRNPALSGQGL